MKNIEYLPFEINGESCCIIIYKGGLFKNAPFVAKWRDKGPNGFHPNMQHFTTKAEASSFLKDQYEYWEKKKAAAMMYA